MKPLISLVPLTSIAAIWVLAQSVRIAAFAAKWLCRRAWLLALLVTLASPVADAGWFTRDPDPKTEAANRALEHAAQLATEAARTQSSQQVQLLQAVEALSHERTHLANHLERLGALATRDSAWAAAIRASGPVLVAVAVLALGVAVVWMVTRAGDRDSQVASMLVEEIVGPSTGLLVGDPWHPRLSTDASADVDSHFQVVAQAATALTHSPEPQEQEGQLPF